MEHDDGFHLFVRVVVNFVEHIGIHKANLTSFNSIFTVLAHDRQAALVHEEDFRRRVPMLRPIGMRRKNLKEHTIRDELCQHVVSRWLVYHFPVLLW